MKKKVLVLLLAVSIVMILTACLAGKTRTTVEILSKDGAGNKTIHISIPKWYSEDSDIDNEQYGFFPSGFEAVKDYIQHDLGDDFEVSYEELDESWDYTVKFSFSSVDDYNAKMKILAGDRWAEVAETMGDATIKVEEADGGFNVTFRENILANKAATVGLLDRIYDKEDLFNPLGGRGEKVCDIFGHENLAGVRVIVGDSSDERTSACTNEDPPLNVRNNSKVFRKNKDFELIVTSFISENGAPAGNDNKTPAPTGNFDKTPDPTGNDDKTPGPTENSNKTPAPADGEGKPSQTGGYIILFAAIILLASAVVLILRKLANSNKTNA